MKYNTEIVPIMLAQSDWQSPPPKRWLRKSLLHFLLIGLALFAAYHAFNQYRDEQSDSRRIVLTEDDFSQMTTAWRAKGRPKPSPEEMQSLLETRIREEVLYREARALGLDKDDTIVKRRMAQQMEWVAEYLSDLREPTIEELKAWFEKNSERFALSPRATFRHLYFSPDKHRRQDHSQQVHEDAEHALTSLSGKPADAPEALSLGDPFMLRNSFVDSSKEQVAKEFGPNFAQSLFQLKPGSWQGPIESGYGWHLIWIDSMTPSRLPQFEEVEPDVKSEWMAERRAEFKRKAFEAMRARYEVVLPDALAKVAAGSSPLPSRTGNPSERK